MSDLDKAIRKQSRLFSLLAVAAAIGLLMGAGFGGLLLKGQADHEKDRRQGEARQAMTQTATEIGNDQRTQLLQEVAATSAQIKQIGLDAKAAAAAIADCTVKGGACKARTDALVVAAVNEIVSRLDTSIARTGDLLNRNAQLQGQVLALVADIVQVRALLAQVAARPGTTVVVPPPSPVLCQLVPLCPR